MKPRPRSVDAPPLIAPWRFPSADPVALAAPSIDPADFIATLGARLGLIADTPVTVTADAASVTQTPSSNFVRSDGMRIALTVPVDFIGAIVGVRCGGAFAPTAAAGAGGVSVTAEVTSAVLAAADATWLGAGVWQPTNEHPPAAVFAFVIAVAGFTFRLPCAIGLAPSILAAAPDTRDWRQSLRAALDATPFAVRAVLHDHVVPLREALAIRVGDVVPIETRRDVSLRLGDRALARGTIGPDDDGGHRVTIVAVGDVGITPATKDLS